MITLTTGQPVPGTDGHVVVDVSGDYEPTDLVLCDEDPDAVAPKYQYQANFIATGEFA